MRLVLSLITSAFIAFSQVEAHGHERSMHPREIASRQVCYVLASSLRNTQPIHPARG